MKRTSSAVAFGIWVATTAFASEGPMDYDRVYPIYGELCAGSQISKIPGFGANVQGQQGGHSALFLKGACRDRDADYPKIRVCDPIKDAGLEQGVSVSADADYRNVNWVSVPSKQLFFYGDLQPGERLTKESYLRSRAKIEALDLFRGVEFHPEILATAPTGMPPQEFMYEDTAGTDYALNFGRTLHCARVPLTAEGLAKTVDYLNSLNEKYRHQDYTLDFIYNNCTHTAHNGLAAAGVWEPLETDQFIAIQAFNLAVPLNAYVELMERGNQLPLENPAALYRDRSARKQLLEKGWLPVQHGVLAEILPIYPENDLYVKGLDSILLDLPMLDPVQKLLERYSTKPRYTDVRANLEYFLQRYLKIQAAKKPASRYWSQFRHGKDHDFESDFDRDEFELFHAKLYEWIDRQIADVRAKLAQG